MFRKFLFIASLTVCGSAYAQNWDSLKTVLNTMAILDQRAAGLPPEVNGRRDFTDDFKRFKDSVFTANHGHMITIFERFGYPGSDKIGKDGSHNYWLIVQHFDKWPEFQQKILSAMEPLAKSGLAAGADFAYLTDRVRLNTGGKQLYGTQVTYNIERCQAVPRSLEDPEHVNERRKEMGMIPLEKYLNTMSEMHYQMNPETYANKGVKGPTLYAVKAY